MKDERLRKLLNLASLGPRPNQITPIGLCHRCERRDEVEGCPLGELSAVVKCAVYECAVFLFNPKEKRK